MGPVASVALVLVLAASMTIGGLAYSSSTDRSGTEPRSVPDSDPAPGGPDSPDIDPDDLDEPEQDADPQPEQDANPVPDSDGELLDDDAGLAR